MTKLSIITINRNNSAGLRKTIESVVSQTFTDYEYIVIDGASSDGSVDIIKEYADKITYWVSEPDKGIYNAMNKGIDLAKGEYIQFLNSGDWFYSKNVLQRVFELESSEDILYGDIILYNGMDNMIRFNYPDLLSVFYLTHHMICHQAIFHKKNLFDKRKYDETIQIVADWEFLLHVFYTKNCSCRKIDEIIVYNDGGGVSSIEEKVNIEREMVLHRYFSNRILDDYYNYRRLIESVDQSTLYPFLSIFSKKKRLQRFAKRILKLLLLLTNNKKLIPPERS